MSCRSQKAIRRFAPSPYLFPPRVHQNHVHPLGGKKVHWTFLGFRLAPGGERDYWDESYTKKA